MSKRIVEGLWDCQYCGSKAIGGLTKHCPNCGHPQDKDTKFYMGEKKKYLDEELAEQYGKGADWHCQYCGSMNRFHFQYCSNCASPKEVAEDDYYSLHPEAKQPQPSAEKSNQPYKDNKNAKSSKKNKEKKKSKKKWIILSVILLLVASALFAFWPRTYDATVTAASWVHEIDIEAYRTVQESDWSVPDGGRVYDQKTEFSHYEQVLDHYETRTRQVSEQVYDGEDYYTSYVDNGDGTFTEETHSTPRYRTEYRTETYQEPIYRDEPVYATKYYYDIDKWVVDRTERTKGVDEEPYWPDYTLAENERVGLELSTYVLGLKTEEETYYASVPLEVWEKYHAGDQAEIQVIQGDVIKIGDYDIE